MRCRLFESRLDIYLHLSEKNMPQNLDIKNIVRTFANNKEERRIGVKKKQYTTDQEQIARFAKAMGHPARMAILAFLAKRDSCFFGDIHDELPIAKATVSQHLKELKEAGLIQGEIETPKVRYCINLENWELARKLFAAFLGDCKCKDTSCCD